MPPFAVFAYKRLPYYVTKNIPLEWGVGRSHNGWMTEETFFNMWQMFFIHG